MSKKEPIFRVLLEDKSIQARLAPSEKAILDTLRTNLDVTLEEVASITGLACSTVRSKIAPLLRWGYLERRSEN